MGRSPTTEDDGCTGDDGSPSDCPLLYVMPTRSTLRLSPAEQPTSVSPNRVPCGAIATARHRLRVAGELDARLPGARIPDAHRPGRAPAGQPGRCAICMAKAVRRSIQDNGVTRGRLSGGSRGGGLAVAGAEAGDGGDAGPEEQQRDDHGGVVAGGQRGPGPKVDRLGVDLAAAVEGVGQWCDPGQWCADKCGGDQGYPGESGQVADRGEGVVAEPGERQQPGRG